MTDTAPSPEREDVVAQDGRERPVAIAPFDVHSLPLADCTRTEFVIPLLEHEQASVRPEGWPEAVRVRMEREIVAWCEANIKTQVVRAITFGVGLYRGKLASVVAVLHHTAKKG